MRHSNQSPALTVIVPCYNENEKVIQETFKNFPKEWELIIVDDGSRRPLPCARIRHTGNGGYGRAIKCAVRESKADLVVTMDGDGQHTLMDVRRLHDFIRYFPHLSMVVGDRRVKETSFKRWLGRKILNWMATLMANRWIPDLNSGLRIFKRDVALGYEPILCNGFSYTASLTMSMLCDGYSVDWLPIKVHSRHYGRSKVSLLLDGITTLRYILVIGLALRTRTLRRWFREW